MLKIYKKYFKLNKDPNNYTGISNLKLLKKSNIKYPDFQRILNDDNIREIEKEHQNNTLNTILFEIGYLNNEYYLIDGQHRYRALLNINNEKYEFTVHLHKVNSVEELKNLFFLINKHTKIPDEWINIDSHDELKINMSNIFNLFIFRESLKTSKKPQRPNLSRTELENIITNLYQENIKLTYKHFNELNNFYKNLESNNFPFITNKSNEEYLTKCNEKNECYLGMVILKNNNYEILIEDLKKIYTNEKIDIKIYDNKNIRRQHIPQSMRESCWKEYKKMTGQQNIDEIKCPISYCSNLIDSFNFECGHIISDKNNGPLNLENLRPICSNCNKSMGSTNWVDYENKFK